MRNWRPRTFFILGFILVMLGFLLPLLMVLNLIESTYFLNFFSFAASFIGLMFGLIGSASYISKNRRK